MLVATGFFVIGLAALIVFWRYHILDKLNKRLLENVERFEISHKFSNSGIWEYNIKDGELYWSRMISKMFGGPEGNITTSYESFVSAIHPDDLQFVLDAIDSCIEGGEEYNVTYRVVWPDGTVRWLAVCAYSSRDSHGAADRMVGVVQDVSERKQIEDNLLTQSQIVTNMEEGRQLSSGQRPDPCLCQPCL